jgi:hypothetical protein
MTSGAAEMGQRLRQGVERISSAASQWLEDMEVYPVCPDGITGRPVKVLNTGFAFVVRLE